MQQNTLTSSLVLKNDKLLLLEAKDTNVTKDRPEGPESSRREIFLNCGRARKN